MASQTRPMTDYAKVIRSKNSGPFELTFDIMFDRDEPYLHVKRSGVLTVQSVARAFAIAPDQVLVCTPFDAARAFKITIRRPVSSGDVTDRDVYGCQQHVPLTRMQVPA
ncbi:DUF4387 domain-containing protein [Orrella sp. JC864]|uniref:DUF4387 domain-containing protein n=1 Tax=Orrella sp. JC864 TaxID=3120298 RepID=UPI0012BD2DB2